MVATVKNADAAKVGAHSVIPNLWGSKEPGPTASIEENGVEKKFAPSTLIPNLWGKTLAESE